MSEAPREDAASGAPDERDYNSASRRWLRMRQELKAAKDERDAWAQEALAHRRRLGIPLPCTGPRVTRAEVSRAIDASRLPDQSTREEEVEE